MWRNVKDQRNIKRCEQWTDIEIKDILTDMEIYGDITIHIDTRRYINILTNIK